MTNHETAIFLEEGEITLEPFASDLRSTIEEVV
jgi:hypothetical protein